MTALAKHLVTWAAQIWEGHKTQAQPSLHLWGVPKYLNLSSLDLGSAYKPGPASDSSRQSNLEPKECRQGKHTRRERGQTQCGRDTVSTCQCYLFAVSLPPHSATEQVSLKKCPPLPPCVRAEIRHWRDQQTEAAKTEETSLEVTGAIDWNPVVSTDYIGRGLQILRNISRIKELCKNELTPHCPQQHQRKS